MHMCVCTQTHVHTHSAGPGTRIPRLTSVTSHCTGLTSPSSVSAVDSEVKLLSQGHSHGVICHFTETLHWECLEKCVSWWFSHRLISAPARLNADCGPCSVLGLSIVISWNPRVRVQAVGKPPRQLPSKSEGSDSGYILRI